MVQLSHGVKAKVLAIGAFETALSGSKMPGLVMTGGVCSSCFWGIGGSERRDRTLMPPGTTLDEIPDHTGANVLTMFGITPTTALAKMEPVPPIPA
jgi:hypothetical protein